MCGGVGKEGRMGYINGYYRIIAYTRRDAFPGINKTSERLYRTSEAFCLIKD